MRQRGQAGLAQHQADVGVGHQQAVAVDHVGLARFADVDARDHLPDELQVELGNRDRPLGPAGADRDRHVGLGAAVEVHRAEPGRVGQGAPEGGLRRPVAAGAQHVHADPRDLDLLAPGAVEQRDVGDLGRLAQQPPEFRPPGLQVRGLELGQRGVGQLLRHLLHVLLDARRRTQRFLGAAGWRGPTCSPGRKSRG